jgi:hemolysin activation/secretion protein
MFNSLDAGTKTGRRNRAFGASFAALVIIAATTVAQAALAAGAPPLRTVVFRGATAFGAPDLFGTYRDALGKPVTRESARSIAAAVARLYQDGGFARPELRLDQALLPQGMLRLDVHEARIIRVVIEGEAGDRRGELAAIADSVRQSVIRGE